MIFDATQAHFDLADRFRSYPALSALAIITEKPRPQTEGEPLSPGDVLYNPIELAVAAITGAGACIIVMEPDLSESSLSEPLYWKKVSFEVVTFSNLGLSMASGGSGLRSWNIANHCEKLLRHFASPGLYHEFLVTNIQPFRGAGLPPEILEKLKQANAEGHILRAVTQVQRDALAPCADPVLDCAAPFTAPKTVTATCATAGAKIYYTLDGTYPGSGRQPTAASYVLTGATIAVTTAGVLRCAAEATGYEPSNIVNAVFA